MLSCTPTCTRVLTSHKNVNSNNTAKSKTRRRRRHPKQSWIMSGFCRFALVLTSQLANTCWTARDKRAVSVCGGVDSFINAARGHFNRLILARYVGLKIRNAFFYFRISVKDIFNKEEGGGICPSSNGPVRLAKQIPVYTLDWQWYRE